MNDKNRIEAVKTKLNERIGSINERFLRARGVPLVPDEDESLLISNKDLEISGQIRFYDEKWRETLSGLKGKYFDRAKEYFMMNFNVLLEKKVDLSDISVKADRSYVDSLLDEMNNNAENMLDDLFHQKYDEIRDKVEQAQFNLETITQQFESSIELLKRDLIRIKKQAIVTVEPFDPKKITQDPKKIRIKEKPPKIKHNFPLMTPLSNTVKPHPLRDQYRPKSRPQRPSLPPIDAFKITNEFVKIAPKVTTPR
jgi:hypothetical protein